MDLWDGMGMRAFQTLSEALRVLVPGGRFLCMEFSHVTNPLLKSIYDTYSFELIPVLGELIANDRESYQYLVESIRQFPDQDNFASMIKTVGFHHVIYESILNGVVAIHSGYKPFVTP
jgi:2-methoxy-6-polyprenyl-1,4-benzoquinol methylase